MKIFLAVIGFIFSLSGVASAQSGCSTIIHGAVLTAGQWNACFATKQNTLGYTPLNTAGGSMTGPLNLTASTSLTAGLNIGQGTAPTSPANGDFWATSAGFFGRADGVTYGPFAAASSASLAATAPIAVSFSGGTATYAINYNSSFTLSGSNLALSANGVSSANFRQSLALSVVGNPTVSTANVQDIQASAAYQPLRVNSDGSAVGFGAIDVSQAAAVTGLLRAGSFPILTGDVTTTGGSLATTLATAQPGAHTWAATQTFTLAPVFTNQSGSRTALGLGTMATQNASAVAVTGGTIVGLTGLAVRDTSAAFDLTLAATSSTALTAGRALTFDVVNGSRTVKLGSNLTVVTDPGAVTGALKSNGSGTFSQAAASDISNGTSGSGAICLVTSCSMTTPAIAGGTHTGVTSFGLRDTSAAFDVTLAATSSTALTAGRTLTLNMGNVSHTLSFGTTANTITFPNLASYTVITSGDTGSVTNTMLAGSIAASKLIGTDIASVGTLTAGAASTGFTIQASNVTWTGTIPAANLPLAADTSGSPSATAGAVKCDGLTVTCSSGIITASGASAASIDAGGATSISNPGTTGGLLFNNAGVVGNTTNPTALTGATITANSLTAFTLQDASSSQDTLKFGVSTTGGFNSGAAPGAKIQFSPNSAAANNMLTIQSERILQIAATSSVTNTSANPTMYLGDATSACCLLPGPGGAFRTIPGVLFEYGNQQTAAAGPGPFTINFLSKSKNTVATTGSNARDVHMYLWNFEDPASPRSAQPIIAFWSASGTWDNPSASVQGTSIWEIGGFAYCGTYDYCINHSAQIRGMLESAATGTNVSNASAPGNLIFFNMRNGATDVTIGAGLYSTGTFAIGSWADYGNNFNTGNATLTIKENGTVSSFTSGAGVFYVDNLGQPRYLNNNASGSVAGNYYIPVLNGDTGTNGHPICYATSTTNSVKLYVAAGTSCP